MLPTHDTCLLELFRRVLLLRRHQTGECVTESARYLEPTRESGLALLMRGIAGPVVMLNLLRFRAIADYSASPELAPSAPISGAAAFDRYVLHTYPFCGPAAAT